MIKFSVPYNGDPQIVKISLAKYRQHIESFYGSMPKDLIGGGRALNINQQSSLKELKMIVTELREHGIDFKYTINSADLLNREYEPRFLQQFKKFLGGLRECGVNIITLSNIFLIDFVKNELPYFKICASVNLKTRTPDEVLFLANSGCSQIILHYDILKNYSALVQISKIPNIAYELIVNDVYIMECPWQKGHVRMQGAHSRNKKNKTPYFSYYRNKCVNLRHHKPDEIMKSMWIPPDQLWRYENLGLSIFKLLDRKASTEWNLRVLEAYIAKKNTVHLEKLLGTYGAVSKAKLLPALDESDPPYPTNKLEAIPSINLDSNHSDKAHAYFLSQRHPSQCYDCCFCAYVVKASIIFSEGLRETAIENNKNWQSGITKLDFIKSLENHNQGVKYE